VTGTELILTLVLTLWGPSVRTSTRGSIVAGVAAAAIGGALQGAIPTHTAAGEPWAGAVTIRVAVVYYGLPSAVWRGTFVSVLPSGRVVDRGAVVDRPRQKLGSNWAIWRTLLGKAGTLRFRIVGPYRTPTATLKWTILGGTKAYAGLSGTGTEVEHVAASRADARMTGVPLH
jgi:hypothetical protein